MLKTLAVLFIAFGFAFGGHCLASFHEKRATVLNDIILMLSIAETQLRYACIPVTDLMNIFEENGKLQNLGFISVCKEKISRGEDFPHAWSDSIEADRELCRLVGTALPYLFGFGDDLGATDINGQLSCCEYYKQIFSKELSEREEQCKKYSKLFPALGAMLGISAAIIII